MTQPTQLWKKEFDDTFAVPQAILDFVARGQMKDISWHNEVCPHFEVQTMTTPLSVWVNHPDPENRELPTKRFFVCMGEQETDSQELLQTDDQDELVAYINQHIQMMGRAYARTDQTSSFLMSVGWEASERGNIWLMSRDSPDSNAWIRLNSSLWLKISIREESYPGLNVSATNISDTDLAAHINKECGGMQVRKCNLNGVAIKDGFIQEEEE